MSQLMPFTNKQMSSSETDVNKANLKASFDQCAIFIGFTFSPVLLAQDCRVPLDKREGSVKRHFLTAML
jgi:hypothetical protein